MPILRFRRPDTALTTDRCTWDTAAVGNAANGRLRMRVCYGSIGMEREWCPECKDWAFVLGGEMACCGLKRPRVTPPIYRGSIATGKRQSPPPDERGRILSSQRGRCFYCGSVFGDVVENERRIKSRVLVPQWDHVEPFCWQSNNQTINFVAACFVCNGN